MAAGGGVGSGTATDEPSGYASPPAVSNADQKYGDGYGAFDGEKELDGISRYIRRAFSPSLFQQGSPPLAPNTLGGDTHLGGPPPPQPYYNQPPPEAYRPMQIQMHTSPPPPAAQAADFSAPPSPSFANSNADEFQRARLDESARHQQQLKDLHEYYQSEIQAARNQATQGVNPEGNASLLEEMAAPEIARLRASLRDQGKEFQIREQEMRDKMKQKPSSMTCLRVLMI